MILSLNPPKFLVLHIHFHEIGNKFELFVPGKKFLAILLSWLIVAFEQGKHYLKWFGIPVILEFEGTIFHARENKLDFHVGNFNIVLVIFSLEG